jgi:hypothetical protein
MMSSYDGVNFSKTFISSLPICRNFGIFKANVVQCHVKAIANLTIEWRYLIKKHP